MQTKEKLGGHRASQKTNFICDEILPNNNPHVGSLQGRNNRRQIDLYAEFTIAAQSFSRGNTDTLSNHYNAPSNARFRVPGGALGIARVEANDGLYEPSESGWGAIVMVTAIIAGGGLEDLLAFRPASPESWWLRKGAAKWLGEWEVGRRMVTAPIHINPPALMPSHRTDEPLHVFSNPLEWLRAGCDGCVPLTPEAYADLIYVQTPLTFGDVDHLEQAQSLMRCPVGLPEAFIRVEECAA